MAVIRSQMIQRIMTGISPLGLAVHITGGMIMTIMITIMTVVIVVLIRLYYTKGDRIKILTTRMIPHPQMALTDHHVEVGMKHLTRTHPLKQRIGIDTDVDPIVVVGPSPITTGVTMGVVPMTVAVIAPLTRQARRVIEVDEMRGVEATMTIGLPGATHAPCECAGVQGRGQCPLIPLHIMSGAMMTTLMKTNTRQNFCVGIKVLFTTK